MIVHVEQCPAIGLQLLLLLLLLKRHPMIRLTHNILPPVMPQPPSTSSNNTHYSPHMGNPWGNATVAQQVAVVAEEPWVLLGYVGNKLAINTRQENGPVLVQPLVNCFKHLYPNKALLANAHPTNPLLAGSELLPTPALL